MELRMGMTETLFIGILVYLVGKFILSKVSFLQKFFIPAPIIGGVFFSIITTIGYSYNLFQFYFDTQLRDILMCAFFTTIGFSASGKLLKKGGPAVFIFLFSTVIILVIQNIIALSVGKTLGLSSMMSLSLGSISLMGGAGTSAAFAPILESHGAHGALSVAIASNTFGMIFGSLIAGPVGSLLLKRHKVDTSDTKSREGFKEVTEFLTKSFIGIFNRNSNYSEDSTQDIRDQNMLYASIYIVICMGLGAFITSILKFQGIVLPAYLVPMLCAAIFRNIMDLLKKEVHMREMSSMGGVFLVMFLSITLMSLQLWDLYALALPVILILVLQVIVMMIYGYFITFRMMGKNYDAIVLSVGQCGFGLGATPNAIANMESFTKANGPSEKAFVVLPLVASLFIDFCNAAIITGFIAWFS